MMFTASDVLLVLVAAVVITGAIWAVSALTRRLDRYVFVRRRLVCPVRSRPAVVEFMVDRDAPESCCDVIDCSLFEAYEELSCQQVCRASGPLACMSES